MFTHYKPKYEFTAEQADLGVHNAERVPKI